MLCKLLKIFIFGKFAALFSVVPRQESLFCFISWTLGQLVLQTQLPTHIRMHEEIIVSLRQKKIFPCKFRVFCSALERRFSFGRWILISFSFSDPTSMYHHYHHHHLFGSLFLAIPFDFILFFSGKWKGYTSECKKLENKREGKINN